MGKPMPWFRFYSEAIRDTKLRRIARETNNTVAEVLGIWAILLSFAGESPERGKLVLSGGNPITIDDLDDVAGCNVSETLQKLERNGMVTIDDGVISVSAWDKRQYDSDNSTKRVQAYRNKVKTQEDATFPKRARNVSVTAPDTDIDTDTELTTLPAAPATSGKDPDVIRQSSSNHPSPAPKPKRALNPHYELARAIAQVCSMDLKANEGRLLREAQQLSGASPPPSDELVRAKYGDEEDPPSWWYANDWRGKQGQRPTPATLRQTWGQWQLSTPKAGNNGRQGQGFSMGGSGKRSSLSGAELEAKRAEWERLEAEMAERNKAAGRTHLSGVSGNESPGP